MGCFILFPAYPSRDSALGHNYLGSAMSSCEELTHWKDPDAGRDWGQEEKGTTEDEIAGWHHRLNGHGFE